MLLTVFLTISRLAPFLHDRERRLDLLVSLDYEAFMFGQVPMFLLGIRNARPFSTLEY